MPRGRPKKSGATGGGTKKVSKDEETKTRTVVDLEEGSENEQEKDCDDVEGATGELLPSAPASTQAVRKVLLAPKGSKVAGSFAAKDNKAPEKNRFEFSKLLNQLHPIRIAEAAIHFLKNVPHVLWNFFIEAFLIPSYRPEWTRYTVWKPLPSDNVLNHDPEIVEKDKRHSGKKRRKKLKMAATVPKPVLHNHSLCQTVTINVSGKIYEPQLKTLLQYPNTLLGDPVRLAQFYDPVRNDYFIDRSRSCFEAIIYYYQSRGILRRPYNVSMEIFEDEVLFYDLGQSALDKLKREEGLIIEAEKPIPRNLLQRKLWLLFEYPESSQQARVVAVLSIIVVVISIFIFCLETVDGFQPSDNDPENLDAISSTSLINDPFFMTETICICWFVFEFVVRLCAAPGKVEFFKSMSNLIDLVAIIPYFVSLFMSQQRKSLNKTTTLTIFRVVRLVRVFRILKLSRHNRGLKVLGKTLKASIRELGLLMFFLGIGVILFSSAVYFAELQHPQTHFKSIISAFWWSVITMTTCGYGDNVPQTVLGKTVGALCAIAGVLTLALPVPVIVSNFNNFYNREEDSAIANIESDHVVQCPYRSGWYGIDGSEVLDNPNPEMDNSILSTWVDGQHRPDDSDSDFETLRKVDYYNNKELRARLRKLGQLGNAAMQAERKSNIYTSLLRAKTYSRSKAAMFIPAMGPIDVTENVTLVHSDSDTQTKE